MIPKEIRWLCDSRRLRTWTSIRPGCSVCWSNQDVLACCSAVALDSLDDFWRLLLHAGCHPLCSECWAEAARAVTSQPGCIATAVAWARAHNFKGSDYDAWWFSITAASGRYMEQEATLIENHHGILWKHVKTQSGKLCHHAFAWAGRSEWCWNCPSSSLLGSFWHCCPTLARRLRLHFHEQMSSPAGGERGLCANGQKRYTILRKLVLLIFHRHKVMQILLY